MKSLPASSDYSARLEFLRATSACWKPDPLDSLADLRPLMRAYLATVFSSNAPAAFEVQLQAGHICSPQWKPSSPAAVALRNGISAWKSRFPFPGDSWIEDAGRSTLYFVEAAGEPWGEWYLTPDTDPAPVFVPKMLEEFKTPEGHGARWIKWEHGETEQEFAKRARKVFERRLAQYVTAVKRRYGARPKCTERDAEWLARHLAGESWGEIGRNEFDDDDSRDLVRKAVSALARRAGLTLRPFVGTFVGTPVGKPGQMGTKAAKRK